MDFSSLRSFRENILEVNNVELNQNMTLDDIKLYQPTYTDLIMTDKINCIAVQAFLRMCNLNYSIVYKYNAEHMSPSGEVPVLKCGKYLLSDLATIVTFLKQRGISLTKRLEDSERTEIIAYTSLVRLVLGNAENFMSWSDQETFHNVTAVKFASTYPWPLCGLLARRKRRQVLQKLKAMGWCSVSLEEVCKEVDVCCNALAENLDGRYFFGNTPTELDAIVFAHVYAISTTPPKTPLGSIIASYPKIIDHCQYVIDNFFEEKIQF